MSSPARAEAPKVGQRAADFELRDLEGKSVRLSTLRGKAVLVDFWASWCEPCKKEIPALAQLARKLATQNIVIIAINVDAKRETAESFLKDHNVALNVLLDPKQTVIGLYEPPKMPTSFVLDRQGVVRFANFGFEPGDEAKIEKQLVGLTGK
jgi:peroxiredoxin